MRAAGGISAAPPGEARGHTFDRVPSGLDGGHGREVLSLRLSVPAQGYRIATGQSHESMMVLANAAKATFIVSAELAAHLSSAPTPLPNAGSGSLGESQVLARAVLRQQRLGQAGQRQGRSPAVPGVF